MRVYIVCTRQYHSLERAFHSEEEAVQYCKDMRGAGWRREFDIVSVPLGDDD